jgi:hypothetical protein
MSTESLNCVDCLFHDSEKENTHCRIYGGVNNTSLAILCKKYEKDEGIYSLEAFQAHLEKTNSWIKEKNYGTKCLGKYHEENEDAMHLIYGDNDNTVIIYSLAKSLEPDKMDALEFHGEELTFLITTLQSYIK